MNNQIEDKYNWTLFFSNLLTFWDQDLASNFQNIQIRTTVKVEIFAHPKFPEF